MWREREKQYMLIMSIKHIIIVIIMYNLTSGMGETILM